MKYDMVPPAIDPSLGPAIAICPLCGPCLAKALCSDFVHLADLANALWDARTHANRESIEQ